MAKKLAIGSALVAGVSALALVGAGGIASAADQTWQVKNQHGRVGGQVMFFDDGDDFLVSDMDADGWSVYAQLYDDADSYEPVDSAWATGRGDNGRFHFNVKKHRTYTLEVCLAPEGDELPCLNNHSAQFVVKE